MASTGPKYTNKLRGQRVLVLGGTSGMGFATAEAALENGASVVISSSSQEKLDKALGRLRAAIAAAGLPEPDVAGKTVDLANRATVEEDLVSLFEFATDGGSKKLDHVVHSAGNALPNMPLDDFSPDTLERGFMVRLWGAALIAKQLPKYVRVSSDSSYTMTGGIFAWRPIPTMGLVSSMASGVEGLARGMAIELVPIRVNAVVPGAIRTELLESFAPPEHLEAVLDTFRSSNPLAEVGAPADIAETNLFLMKCKFVNGTSILIDGGCRVSSKIQGMGM